MSIAHEHLARARESFAISHGDGYRGVNDAITHALISIAASLAGPEPAQPEKCPVCQKTDISVRGRKMGRTCNSCGAEWSA